MVPLRPFQQEATASCLPLVFCPLCDVPGVLTTPLYIIGVEATEYHPDDLRASPPPGAWDEMETAAVTLRLRCWQGHQVGLHFLIGRHGLRIHRTITLTGE